MVYQFTRALNFFLHDKPLKVTVHQKYAYPAVNHELAYRYAEVLDRILDWSQPDSEAKSVGHVYHKMLSHTFKHVLHKYKNIKGIAPTHRVFAINDFFSCDGEHVSYCDYPLTDDLVTLKRELGRLTNFKVDAFNEVQDKHLQLLGMGAINDLCLYSYREFKRDFDEVNQLWEDIVAFAKENHEKEKTKLLSGVIKTHIKGITSSKEGK